MAWIQVHQSLVRHRKLLTLAAQLSIPPAHALGHLVSLWLWCLDNAPTGSLTSLAPAIIATASDWTGDPVTWTDALASCGWLDRNSDTLTLHDWDDYAGSLIARRQAQRDIMRKRRAAVTTTLPPRDSNAPLSSREHNVSSTLAPRVEYSRVDKSTTAAAVPPYPPQAAAAEKGIELPQDNEKRVTADKTRDADNEKRDNDFCAALAQSYEANIGIMTPLIADKLKALAAEHHPPVAWATEAVSEAVAHNARTWAYVAKVLETWCTQGRKAKPSDAVPPDKWAKEAEFLRQIAAKRKGDAHGKPAA